jgi:hypothetical protein
LDQATAEAELSLRQGMNIMEAERPRAVRFLAMGGLATLLAGCGGSSPGADNSISAPIPVSGIVALTCHLKAGVHAEIGPRIEKYERNGNGLELTFTEFDWANHRARMIGNHGAAVVEARLEGPPVQMVFVERAPWATR